MKASICIALAAAAILNDANAMVIRTSSPAVNSSLFVRSLTPLESVVQKSNLSGDSNSTTAKPFARAPAKLPQVRWSNITKTTDLVAIKPAAPIRPKPGVNASKIKVTAITGPKAVFPSDTKSESSSDPLNEDRPLPQIAAPTSAGNKSSTQLHMVSMVGNKPVILKEYPAAFRNVPSARNHIRSTPHSRHAYRNISKTQNLHPRGSGPDEVCIDFTSDLPNWYWTRQPPWGEYSGSSQSLKNGRMCVPRDADGGALFIGAHPNPSSGSTKLECMFPANGDQAWCNMSLVDGFSLPVTCTMGDKKMGGKIDLWQNEHLCKDQRQKHRGVCLSNKESRGQGYVGEFFQPAVRNGHHYCIWTSCSQIPKFPVNAEIKCHVGSTKLSPGTA